MTIIITCLVHILYASFVSNINTLNITEIRADIKRRKSSKHLWMNSNNAIGNEIYQENAPTRCNKKDRGHDMPSSKSEEHNELCTVCGDGTDFSHLVICENGVNCNNGVHLHCLKPQLTEVPNEPYFCGKSIIIVNLA